MTHQEPSAVIYIPAYALLKGRCFCAPVCRLYVIAHAPFVTWKQAVCLCVRVCILDPLLAASALCPLDNCAEKQCQKASNHNCHQKKRAFVRNQVKIMQLATWNCSDTDMLPTFTFLMSFKYRWIRFSVKKKKKKRKVKDENEHLSSELMFFLYLRLFSHWMFSEAFVILPNCEYI